ncbi:MAG: DUF368 domain-containing protein, partial [Planctomycetales bacterium]|nr:DUF368 domain-containing protein [Planctomycetales bacterium]
LAVLGAMAALWLQRLNPPNPDIAIADLAAVRPSFPFLFLCATTAICAMILPGISGAMVLLMWGVYAYLADIPHLLVHGEEIALCLKTIAVFGAGCALGLLTFSKVLRWLLELHRAPTLATLAGVMLGALPQIWPFQTDLTPHIEKVKYKQFQPILPGSWDGEVTACLLVALLAGALVLAVDYSRRWFPSDSDGGQTEAR